jgi:hypothetical protein
MKMKMKWWLIMFMAFVFVAAAPGAAGWYVHAVRIF